MLTAVGGAYKREDGVFVALGHGGQLFVVEPEGEGLAAACSPASEDERDGGLPSRQAGGGVLRRAGASVHGSHRAFAQWAGRGAEHPPRPVAHGAGPGVRHGDHGVQGWGV